MTDSPWFTLVIAFVVVLIAAIIATAVIALVFRLIARKQKWAQRLLDRSRRPFRINLILLFFWLAYTIFSPLEDPVDAMITQCFTIVLIATGAWFLCSLALFFEDSWLSRYESVGSDDRIARRVQTQVQVIRRLTVAATVILAAGAILLTFPEARAAGASLLASAGLISVIAGIAAQSTLGNVFAGMQLAFSDAIRVQDVVIVEGEWGRIEEITLTYVVLHIWDDRRMVVPSTYFTTTPFENWTRRNSELLGSVEFDLDWRMPPEAMREELDRILENTELWDGRTGVIQITDAVGGYVRARVLVSAATSGDLWDLRCLVREKLVTWMFNSSPQSYPRSRVQLVEEPAAEKPKRGAAKKAEESANRSALFTGEENASRGENFTGPIQTVPRSELAEADLDEEGFDRNIRGKSRHHDHDHDGDQGDAGDGGDGR